MLGGRGDDNTCEENRGRRIDRRDLVAYLLSMEPPGQGPNAIGDIDNGLLNIPQPFLACRAISISPGGASRSGNQPFWNAASSSEQIITDREIANALRRYRERFPDSLGFVGTVGHYWSFYVATSFAWDAAGALANALLILVTGVALLRAFRRFSHRLDPVSELVDA